MDVWERGGARWVVGAGCGRSRYRNAIGTITLSFVDLHVRGLACNLVQHVSLTERFFVDTYGKKEAMHRRRSWNIPPCLITRPLPRKRLEREIISSLLYNQRACDRTRRDLAYTHHLVPHFAASTKASESDSRVPARVVSRDGVDKIEGLADSPRSNQQQDNDGGGLAASLSDPSDEDGSTTSSPPARGLKRLTRKLSFRQRQAQANLQVWVLFVCLLSCERYY